jgi:ribonuclease E
VPSSDDPPNTVVHVRAPRTAAEEAVGDVRSIKGSTRLEAKRQRRREGRESGRRRPPIITESEFLARREAVDRVMVVRQTGDRTQIAVMEDGVLVEHYVDKASHQSYVGNVYLGKVQNVLPSMEAAFVDIGKGRNAVLYAGEVNFDASGLEGESKRIESALKSGQSILVQATKDPIGHKGARLTSQVSLPGRYLVYVPGASMTGISRKLPDTERTRLKQILKQVMPENAGVIVRTAAEGAAEEELARDVNRLDAQWEAIERRAKSATAPELLYSEPDLTIRVVRDIFNEDFTKLVIASDSEWDIVDEYIRYVAPHLADRLERWTEDHDVFAAYRIDEQIAKALERKVWLPSGGSLVIDTTEAMTVIDVNTGKFTGQGGNLEQTVTRNNLEAAEEIVRQLRVRDVGGIIVIDFIDMVLESNRDLVLRRMLECLARDRTKHQVAEVTSLGLVQMTRKRVGSGLLEAFSVPCEHCNGRGVLISHEPVDHAPAINQRGRSGDDRSGKDDRSADDRPKDGRSGQDGRGRGRSRGGEARADEARTGDGDGGSATGTAGPAKRSRSASARAKAGQAKTDEARSDRDRSDQDRSDQDRADQEHAHQGEASRGGEQATGQQASPEGEQAAGQQARPDDEQPGGAQVSGTQADQRPSSGGRGRRGPARREQAPPAAEHTGAADGPGAGQGQDAEPAAV